MRIESLRPQFELKCKLRYLKPTLNEMPESLFVSKFQSSLGLIGAMRSYFSGYPWSKLDIISYSIQHPQSREFNALYAMLSQESNDLLLKACVNNENQNFDNAILAGADVNKKEIERYESLYQPCIGRSYIRRLTPLHAAAGNGHIKIVQKLIKLGAYVDAREFGVTPIYLASFYGHVESVKVLLGAGAFLHYSPYWRPCTPREAARIRGYQVIVNLIDDVSRVRQDMELLDKNCFSLHCFSQLSETNENIFNGNIIDESELIFSDLVKVRLP